MAEKSSPGTRQTDGKNLVWFGEIERKCLALLTFLPLNYFMIVGIVSEMTAVSEVSLIYSTKQYFKGS